MAETTLKIGGMSCQHCVMIVKKSLDALEGVSSAEVSIGTARVIYDNTLTDRDTVVNAVRNSGYKIEE